MIPDCEATEAYFCQREHITFVALQNPLEQWLTWISNHHCFLHACMECCMRSTLTLLGTHFPGLDSQGALFRVHILSWHPPPSSLKIWRCLFIAAIVVGKHHKMTSSRAGFRMRPVEQLVCTFEGATHSQHCAMVLVRFWECSLILYALVTSLSSPSFWPWLPGYYVPHSTSSCNTLSLTVLLLWDLDR